MNNKAIWWQNDTVYKWHKIRSYNTSLCGAYIDSKRLYKRGFNVRCEERRDIPAEDLCKMCVRIDDGRETNKRRNTRNIRSTSSS